MDLLRRAAPYLRLPDSPETPPEVVADGLRCPATGRSFRVTGGVLDLLPADFAPTDTQKALDTRFSSWVYDRTRAHLPVFFGMPRFEAEVEDVVRRLAVEPGDVVLDVACGHGNFTLALAKRVGPEGLVIGIDVAAAMLRHAARHVQEEQAENVLLVRGDALALPIANGCLEKTLLSGGLHQIPDLPGAFREFARVSRDGARVAASGFATAPGRETGWRRLARSRFDLHAVDLGWLAEQVAKAGYEAVEYEMPSRWIGYLWARRVARGGAAAAKPAP